MSKQQKRKKKQKFFAENNDNIKLYSPKNAQQQRLEESIFNNPITIVSGSAGTGKTLMSIQTLYRLFKKGEIEKIKIVRLVANTFGEKLGDVPGDRKEKLWDFAGPILDNLSEIIPEGELVELFNKYKIEVIPVSRMRGRSFSNTGVLIEESQNLDKEMMITCLTRIGFGSKFIINGDPYQIDFKDRRNGIDYAIQCCENIEGVGIVRFDDQKIERHPLIKPILENAKRIEKKEQQE